MKTRSKEVASGDSKLATYLANFGKDAAHGVASGCRLTAPSRADLQLVLETYGTHAPPPMDNVDYAILVQVGMYPDSPCGIRETFEWLIVEHKIKVTVTKVREAVDKLMQEGLIKKLDNVVRVRNGPGRNPKLYQISDKGRTLLTCKAFEIRNLQNAA